MSDEPWLWLLAGPNGAGKSTFAERNFTDIEGISPDRSALQLEPTAPERVAFLAGRKARLRMRDLLDGRRSFWVETTLSGRSHYRDIQRAKTQGFKIAIIFIGLASANLAVQRVRARKRAGGHDVPDADVRRRYVRSLDNLAPAYRVADYVSVLDNSGKRMKTVLVALNGEIIFRARKIPGWLHRSLRAFLDQGPGG